jgi:hypothetical protein
MKISQQKTVQVEAKTLQICAKVRDCFAASLLDGDGETLCVYDGYVPEFMPGEHFGDYLMLDIDLDTGQITNWKAPTAEQVEGFISKATGGES